MPNLCEKHAMFGQYSGSSKHLKTFQAPTTEAIRVFYVCRCTK